MSERRCLQEITGSCSGCNIRDNILASRLRNNGEHSKEEIARQVQNEWCPEGANIQLAESRRVRIWKGLNVMILNSGQPKKDRKAAQGSKS